MSILTAFETIRQLLQCSYSNTIVNNLLGLLEPLIVETFSSTNVELLSEVLQVVNVLLYKLPENQIPDKFCLLFEFICYSCSEKALYQNRVYQNPFLNYLKDQNPENYDLYEVYIELLRNYVEKGIAQITSTQDELGNNYLELLTELISFI